VYAISQSRKLASRNATGKETQAEIGAASNRPGPLSVFFFEGTGGAGAPTGNKLIKIGEK
jgi:hypothetical protein